MFPHFGGQVEGCNHHESVAMLEVFCHVYHPQCCVTVGCDMFPHEFFEEFASENGHVVNKKMMTTIEDAASR